MSFFKKLWNFLKKEFQDMAEYEKKLSEKRKKGNSFLRFWGAGL